MAEEKEVFYYAFYPFGMDELEYCTDLGKLDDYVPYRYNHEKDDWDIDQSILDMFCGELDAEEITEEQMEYVRERIQNEEAEDLARDRWIKECRAGMYEAYGISKDKY